MYKLSKHIEKVKRDALVKECKMFLVCLTKLYIDGKLNAEEFDEMSKLKKQFIKEYG